MSTTRPLLLLLVAVAAAAPACSSDDDTAVDRATTTTAEAEGTTTTSAGDPTTTTVTLPDCASAPVPAGASSTREASADLDGDGDPDALTSYRTDGNDWHLHVALARGGDADLTVPAFEGESVAVLGGADVDGDGAAELWARTGQGASATVLGLARLVGCDLVRVTALGGEPAELPVGGSVGTASGVECAARMDGTAHVTTYIASNTGGDRYEVRATELALDGTALAGRGSYTREATAGDETFARATSFSCGDLTL